MSTPAASSTQVTRCEFTRLHREPSHSPNLDDCKKRKLQESTPKVSHPTKPATKKRCGRPVTVPATLSTQDPVTSSGSISLVVPQRYPLRSWGQLPTPEPSQNQAAGIERSPEYTSVGAGTATPVQYQNPAQGQESGDTIMVDNSTIASSANGHNRFDRSPSPAGTSMVSETPFEEQPGLEVAEIQDHRFPFARRASDSENPFIGHSPIDNRFSRRLRSTASDLEADNIHYTTRGGRYHGDRDYQAEADGLSASRTALRENLEASTALVHTLQNRLLQNEGNGMTQRALLNQAQADLLEARAQVQGGRKSVARLGCTLMIFVFGVAAYAVWKWVNGPEMQYIRKRRADVLTE